MVFLIPIGISSFPAVVQNSYLRRLGNSLYLFTVPTVSTTQSTKNRISYSKYTDIMDMHSIEPSNDPLPRSSYVIIVNDGSWRTVNNSQSCSSAKDRSVLAMSIVIHFLKSE
ncbi:7034_t:CDS:2 [Acaulospora morrowiae]|uniref:7034_t:CDS:1 n=1 Tax=Acaulospora morrowiae TaxID=94023 RepID=A0A9N9CGV7_9GLOM|nr:7034_t:CDS:2 [Acaulospora morrowiae]